MEVFSKLKNVRSSPNKIRLLCSLIKGKNVINALNILSFINKKSSFILKKVLNSAVYNAINNYNLNINLLKISKIFIDKGSYMKRVFPRAKGRVNYILKKTSNIVIYVSY